MKKTALCSIALVLGSHVACSAERQDDGPTDNVSQISSALVNVPASRNPPGGLTASQVPQFVAFGFDDNAYVDSLNWIRSYLVARRNPAGTGNPATYDNKQLSASFFLTCSYGTSDGALNVNGQTPASVITAWKALYTAGFDVGNHTYSHTGNNVLSEFTRCNDVLTQQVGVPAAQINGFRFPFLYYTAEQFQTMVSAGFKYDTSIEEPWGDPNDAQDYWPWTMDSAAPYAPIAVGNFPGFWELPVYSTRIPAKGKYQAVFDFNLWATEDLTKTQFLDTLKALLNARLAGNRAPVLIGAHTDEYSQYNAGFEGNAAGARWSARRQAIQEFITYALTKSAVRVVSYDDVRKWMENPVPLGGTCTAETNTTFCSRLAKNCGSVTGTDNCGATRTVTSCGSCTSPQTCGGGGTANVCSVPCTAETNTAFCSRLGKNCGSVTGADNCGATRTVSSCGSCTSPLTCGGGGTTNVCGSGATACSAAYDKSKCLTYAQGTKVSRNSRNYTCANGNCANCASTASCEPGATGCPWGSVWTDNGACQ